MQYMKHTSFHPSCQRFTTRRQSQAGFTLIEVLVALLVFAIGLLASAALMLSSLRTTQFAGQSVVGTAFAREYGEFMQLIPASIASTSQMTGDEDLTFDLDTEDGLANTAANCVGPRSACNPTAMINAMKDDWGLRLRTQLPGGRARVCRDTTAPDANGDYNWDDCNHQGQQMRVKIGWAGKNTSHTTNEETDEAWMTQDKPRMIVPIMGNLKDYVAD